MTSTPRDNLTAVQRAELLLAIQVADAIAFAHTFDQVGA